MHPSNGRCKHAPPKRGQRMLQQSQCVPLLSLADLDVSQIPMLKRSPMIWLLQDPFAVKENYHDGPFDKFMVSYFAKQMSEQLGGAITPCTVDRKGVADVQAVRPQNPDGMHAGKPYKPGYDGFVDLSREMMKGRNSKQQQQAVSGVLGAPTRHLGWLLACMHINELRPEGSANNAQGH